MTKIKQFMKNLSIWAIILIIIVFLLDLNMTKINLAITGFKGGMGQQLIKSLKMNKNFKLVALTESKMARKNFKY